MATHSSILAWRIPWTEEPRGLQFTGSQSVRHSESLSLSTVVLEKILESSLDSKEIQPVHPKEISPEYSLVGLKLKLKLQYFGHLI